MEVNLSVQGQKLWSSVEVWIITIHIFGGKLHPTYFTNISTWFWVRKSTALQKYCFLNKSYKSILPLGIDFLILTPKKGEICVIDI